VALVHYPLYRLSAALIQPIAMNYTLGEIHSGDVFLAIQPSAASQPLQPGEIIAFEVSQNVMRSAGYHIDYRYQVQGFWIERVLARGPCRVISDGQRLIVDGQEVSWRPLTIPLPSRFDVSVPENHVLYAPLNPERLIPNSRLPVGNPISNQLLVVPESRVLGRVMWQTWPIWRWGRMN
jgi:hypothetical protein